MRYGPRQGPSTGSRGKSSVGRTRRPRRCRKSVWPVASHICPPEGTGIIDSAPRLVRDSGDEFDRMEVALSTRCVRPQQSPECGVSVALSASLGFNPYLIQWDLALPRSGSSRLFTALRTGRYGCSTSRNATPDVMSAVPSSRPSTFGSSSSHRPNTTPTSC